MEAFFMGLSPLGKFYAVCAFLGGLFFVIRLIIQFTGAGAVDDMDATDLHKEPNSDLSFKVLSLQGLSAFFMMFGLVGIALHKEWLVGPYTSVSAGTTAGIISVLAIQWLFG